MKKVILSFLIAGSLVACDNAANSDGDAKDSLDSIANEKKENIDSSADVRKDVIDSTTENQKEAIDRIDSMNVRKDSASH
jgi:hypothetical protein